MGWGGVGKILGSKEEESVQGEKSYLGGYSFQFPGQVWSLS